MANKPINRFEIQYVFPDGDGYLRWKSKPGHTLTGPELVDHLRKIADQIEHAATLKEITAP